MMLEKNSLINLIFVILNIVLGNESLTLPIPDRKGG